MTATLKIAGDKKGSLLYDAEHDATNDTTRITTESSTLDETEDATYNATGDEAKYTTANVMEYWTGCVAERAMSDTTDAAMWAAKEGATRNSGRNVTIAASEYPSRNSPGKN